MAPFIGSDGFTDCNVICDPKGGYSPSCKRFCEGFKFVSTKLTTVHSSTEAQSSRIITPMMPVSLPGSTVTHNSSNNLVINVHHPQWEYILIGVITTFAVLLLLFCFRKRLLKLFARKKLCERLPHSRHEEIQLESIGKRSVEEAKSLLDQSKQNNGGDNNVNKEGEQNKLSTEETHNRGATEPKERNGFPFFICPIPSNGKTIGNADKTVTDEDSEADTVPNDRVGSPVHYDDTDFQVTAHDTSSDCHGNGENDRDSDSETSSVESDVSRLTGCTTPNESVPINQEDSVSRKGMKKTGVTRVITVIDLR